MHENVIVYQDKNIKHERFLLQNIKVKLEIEKKSCQRKKISCMQAVVYFRRSMYSLYQSFFFQSSHCTCINTVFILQNFNINKIMYRLHIVICNNLFIYYLNKRLRFCFVPYGLNHG